MPLDTKMDIWIEVLRTRIPDATYQDAAMLSLKAASDWGHGVDSELSKLFDQFLMLKKLKGFSNGDDEQTEQAYQSK